MQTLYQKHVANSRSDGWHKTDLKICFISTVTVCIIFLILVFADELFSNNNMKDNRVERNIVC